MVEEDKHQSKKAEVHQGVCCLPRINTIEVSNWIVPILHLQLGVINYVIGQLFNDIDQILELVDVDIEHTLEAVIENKSNVGNAEINMCAYQNEINKNVKGD